MIAFCTTLLSSRSTTRSKEFSCASSRFPKMRNRTTIAKYTAAVRRIFTAMSPLPNCPSRLPSDDAITITAPSSSNGGVSLSRDRGAPVDGEDLAGDVAGVVREQEAGDARDVVALGDLAERHGALEPGARLVACSSCPPAIGVSTPPGQMQFARMPCGPPCTATRRVSAATPPLLAV